MTHLAIIKFDSALKQRLGTPEEYIRTRYAQKAFTYLMNSSYRRAVNLEPWIEEQIKNPAPEVLQFLSEHNAIKNQESNDNRVLTIRRVVQGQINYVSDNLNPFHPAVEYWQTAQETLKYREGDCEDGAILIYVLARIAGVPKEDIYLWAGEVQGGGHCCCIYRPDCFWLNWWFLDWCYWPNDGDQNNRPLFQINGTSVTGELLQDGMQTGIFEERYEKMWFVFNENTSYLRFDYKFTW